MWTTRAAIVASWTVLTGAQPIASPPAMLARRVARGCQAPKPGLPRAAQGLPGGWQGLATGATSARRGASHEDPTGSAGVPPSGRKILASSGCRAVVASRMATAGGHRGGSNDPTSAGGDPGDDDTHAARRGPDRVARCPRLGGAPW